MRAKIMRKDKKLMRKKFQRGPSLGGQINTGS